MNPAPFQYPPPGTYGGPQQSSSADENDLNTLSILHYIWTGILAMMTLGLTAYFLLLGGIFGASAASAKAGSGDLAMAAGVIIVIMIFVGLIMATLCVLHFLAASGLRKRTRRTLTLVMSALMCTSMPLGTALGIYTFVVLSRPGVKALYGLS